jgi:uncharacterized protein YigA (DUF484 family)
MINPTQSSSDTQPTLTDRQMRDFIARLKKETSDLVKEGIDRVDLQKRIHALEEALNSNASSEKKSKALDDLEATLIAASDGGVSRDILNFFNQLFGTGMPPV